MIPYGRQNINQDDINAVIEVLQSDFLTQGPIIPKFEGAVARKVGAAHGVAVNSATSALHIAVSAMGVGPGDIVWTSPNTFVASANCARYCGADVDFVDIDPATFNICPKAFAKKLDEAEAINKLPKIIIPVHIGGQSTAAHEIAELARAKGIQIIEDASHAIGAHYASQPVGNCSHSDITIFSFHPVKIITTAEGGMALTNNADLHSKMSLLRNHGITRDHQLMQEIDHGPWYYEQLVLGWNYRMTELQAALGLSQLSRLDDFVIQRRQLADRYDDLLKELPIVLPHRQVSTLSSHHLYIIRLSGQSPKFHRKVFETMRENGINVNLHYIPVHLQPYYKNLGFKKGDFPEAERYANEAISLPLYPDLSIKDQDKVCHILQYAVS